jgi:DNA-binding NtrC family response regulator
MNGMAHDGSVSVLLVGEYENDRALVRDVSSKLGWRLFETRGARRALAWLKRNAVQVVMAEGRTAGSDWQKLLDDLRDLPDPPQLVVTSRIADDHLWSEVLNRGGYDVLPRPLDRDELERVVDGAARQFRSLRDGAERTVAASTAA